MELKALISDLQLLVFDFDGVMTDNRVLVDENGLESVFCHRGDGLGISMLRQAGLKMMILSTEENAVVSARARKLRLPVLHACRDKLAALREIAAERALEPGRIAYMGNDVNDLECMEWVGCPIAVSDASEAILRVARYVTKRPGGYGAVREVADLLLAG